MHKAIKKSTAFKKRLSEDNQSATNSFWQKTHLFTIALFFLCPYQILINFIFLEVNWISRFAFSPNQSRKRGKANRFLISLIKTKIMKMFVSVSLFSSWIWRCSSWPQTLRPSTLRQSQQTAGTRVTINPLHILTAWELCLPSFLPSSSSLVFF